MRTSTGRPQARRKGSLISTSLAEAEARMPGATAMTARWPSKAVREEPSMTVRVMRVDSRARRRDQRESGERRGTGIEEGTGNWALGTDADEEEVGATADGGG